MIGRVVGGLGTGMRTSESTRDLKGSRRGREKRRHPHKENPPLDTAIRAFFVCLWREVTRRRLPYDEGIVYGKSRDESVCSARVFRESAR